MKIGVVGLGLIGGSLCKTISKRTSHMCCGMDVNGETVKKALADGAIHKELTKEQLKNMDVTIICLHPKQTAEFIKAYANHFQKGSIVADVCGIKRAIADDVDGLLAQNGVYYVGTHPMAGREFSGYDYSIDTLFDGASFIITKTERSDENAIEAIRALALEMGFGRVVISDPDEHDEVIAFTSQLAHVVSNAYVKSPSLFKQSGFSAGSFHDLTRVAKLDENMWTDLFMLNKGPLVCELDVIISNLQKYKSALESGDDKELCCLLREGRELKEKSLAQK